MNFSEQIVGWFKPKSTDTSPGVAVEFQIQLQKADLAAFNAIFKLAQRFDLKGRLYMNLAGLITVELEGPRQAMAGFYDRLTSGEFCVRQTIGKFRRDTIKANYKTLTQYFDETNVNYMEKPDSAKPIAL